MGHGQTPCLDLVIPSGFGWLYVLGIIDKVSKPGKYGKDFILSTKLYMVFF